MVSRTCNSLINGMAGRLSMFRALCGFESNDGERKMKKLSLLVWLLLFPLTGALGQGTPILEIRGGYLNPKDTDAGLILGGSYGISIDERVDLSLGIDYFRKNYTKETEVADTSFVSGVQERTVVRELEYNTSLLPISANVNIRMPFQPPLYWYFGGSISYQFLFNEENNYEKGISEKRTYKGWGWMLRAGIEYTIGSRSSIIAEAIYNIGKVKRDTDQVQEGLPIWDEVDVSGLGFRVGLRLEFF